MSKKQRRAAVSVVLNIGGQSFQIASAATAENVDFVVCANVTIPLLMPDNLTAPCKDCGDMLQFRPTNPKRPPRLCIDCTTIRAMRHHRAG